MVDKKRTELEDMVDALQRHQVTRRQFIARASMLGLSLPTIAALVAACGGDDEEGAPAGEAGAPSAGGTLREGYDLDFSRMDPINTTWYDPAFFALYEALITLDEDQNVVPQLAESWETSPDGTTWTFKIREGATFHSGEPLTAQSIAEVFNTIIDPDAGSPQLAQWTPVVKSEARDDQTLVITTRHPFANLPNPVSTGYSRIVNMKTRQRLGDDYGKNEIDGSGPFTFVEWVPGDRVTVKRREDYVGSITPFFENKGKAHLDGITWRFIQEAANRALSIEGGELDALHGPAFQDIERLKGNSDLVVTEVGEMSEWYIGLNFERLEFADLRVRQAVSHALDRNAIVDALVFGFGTPAFGPLPQSDAAFYDPAVEQFNQFDLDEAKSLMTEAGWQPGSGGILAKNGKPFAFTLAVTNESFSTQLASVIQEQLKQLGMDVKVESFDRATHFSTITEGVDAFTFKYLWPNPYDVYTVLSDSKAIPIPNWQRAKLPDIDAAHAAYTSAASPDELKAASSQGQLAGAEQLPFVPIFTPANVWVNTKKVHNYLPIPWNLYPYYNDVWLEA